MLNLLPDLRLLTAVVHEFQLVVILATSDNDPGLTGGCQCHHELKLKHNCGELFQISKQVGTTRVTLQARLANESLQNRAKSEKVIVPFESKVSRTRGLVWRS